MEKQDAFTQALLRAMDAAEQDGALVIFECFAPRG